MQAANPGGKLKPGSSVRVAIVSQTVPKALVVPVASILTGPDGATSVFTLDASNKPIRKTVKVGIRTDTEAQITDGLSEGERVITVGAFELDKEDESVLAKTKILVEAPKPSGAAGSEKE